MKVLILGATSDIGRAFAQQLAQKGDRYLLAARDAEEGTRTAADLQIRTGADATFIPFDATQLATHRDFIQRAADKLDGIDGVIVCFGHLGDQAAAQADFAEAARIIELNFTAAVALLEPAAALLEKQGSGFIFGLSSVAGVRGRRGNYIYGAAKSAFTTYLEGLAHRLAPRGVRVKIAKLGFVKSKMTRGLPMTGLLQTTPEHAARGLVGLLHSKRQSAYVPWRWAIVMTIIRALPAWLFNKTKM